MSSKDDLIPFFYVLSEPLKETHQSSRQQTYTNSLPTSGDFLNVTSTCKNEHTADRD